MNSTTTVGTADPDGTEPKVVHLQVEPESSESPSRRVPVRGSTHNGAREKLARGRPRRRAIMAKLLRTRESSASAAEACSHQIWVAASRPSSAFVATRQRVAFGHCACSARFAPLPEYAKFHLRPFAEQSPGARGLRTHGNDVDVRCPYLRRASIAHLCKSSKNGHGRVGTAAAGQNKPPLFSPSRALALALVLSHWPMRLGALVLASVPNVPEMVILRHVPQDPHPAKNRLSIHRAHPSSPASHILVVRRALPEFYQPLSAVCPMCSRSRPPQS
ncbi:hypothetical protein GY45DRAFT_18405 [Cubamyces sp. BRFM 1775]|nr:hypothetical protein GY45DRAFT_18405 [Cubamyces sp. BRFM 1775]